MNKEKKRGRPEGGVARHRQLATVLRSKITRGEWPTGKSLPSIRQLAREFEVSPQVARLALQLLRKENRVMVMPRRGTRVRNQSEVASAASNMAALILGHSLEANLLNPEFSEVQRGVELEMGRTLRPLLIVHEHRKFKSSIPWDLLDLPVSGILLFGRFQDSVLRQYEKLGLPCVLVDSPCEDLSISSVSVDNEAAARDATLRLFALGHRRIAFLRFVLLRLRKIDPDSQERELGFRKAHDDAEIPLNSDSIINSFAKDHPGSSAIRALLNARPPFTAVLAVDSSRANLVIEGARQRGLNVPKDLSVLCFQSSKAHAGNLSGPRIDFEAMGRRAVQLLAQARKDAVHEKMRTQWSEGETLASATSGNGSFPSVL